VLENGGDEKDWLNPAWTQHGNIEFAKRNRRSDQQRIRRRVMIVSGGDECGGAGVLDLIRIRMDALMQLRGRTEGQCPEKSRGSKDRDRSTRDRAALH